MGVVADDTTSYLRRLRKRGYTVPAARNGRGHIEVWFGDTLVARTSGSGWQGRGFANFKAQIRRFEQDKPTRKTQLRRT